MKKSIQAMFSQEQYIPALSVNWVACWRQHFPGLVTNPRKFSPRSKGLKNCHFHKVIEATCCHLYLAKGGVFLVSFVKNDEISCQIILE